MADSLSLAHNIDINKNKYLVLGKLKNISQTKYIFDQFCQKLKRLQFYGEWAQMLQNLQVNTNFTVGFGS